MGIDTLYAQHIRIAYPGLLVRLGMLASTSQPATLFGLALYTDGVDYPSRPLITPTFQVSAIDTGGTGRQEVVVSPPIHVDAGTYWIAFVSQANAFDLQQPPSGPIATAEAMVAATGNPWLDPFPATSDPPNASADDPIVVYAVVALDPM